MDINYQATKTASRFHRSDKKVRLLFGPVGTGKSVASDFEIFRMALQQAKANDGKRYSRWGIFRNTYPELKSTTINTWKDWFPEKYFGKIKFDPPITQTMTIKDLNAEFIFIALDSMNEIGKIKSLELTGALINELQFFPLAIFTEIQERLNRYPPKKSGAPITRVSLVCDTNPPSSGHWIYHLFEELRPTNHAIFKYAPALVKIDKLPPANVPYERSLSGSIWVNNPAADYRWVQNDPDYWIKLVPGYDDEKIRVSLCGEYGVMRMGKPVYYEYSDQLHCGDLLANDGLEIGLGWDFGLTPAVVITQPTLDGRLLVLDELVAKDMGIEQFVDDVVLGYLNRHYPFWKNHYVSIGDPAGKQRAQTNEMTCLDMLAKRGIITLPASSNAFIARREAVAYFLKRLVGAKPAFMISPKAKVLRNGFLGEYHFKALTIANQTVYKEEPEKNDASHPHDGLQYIALHYYELITGAPFNMTGKELSKKIY